MSIEGLYLQLEKAIQKWITWPEKQIDAQILQDALLIFVRKPACDNLTIARIYYNAIITEDYKELDSVLAVFLRQMICNHEESLIYMRNTYQDDAPIAIAEKKINACISLFKSFLPIAISFEETEQLVCDVIHTLQAQEKHDKEMVYCVVKGISPGAVDLLLAKKIIVSMLGLDVCDKFLVIKK